MPVWRFISNDIARPQAGLRPILPSNQGFASGKMGGRIRTLPGSGAALRAPIACQNTKA